MTILFIFAMWPTAFLRNFAAWVIKTMIGDKVFADAVRSSRKKNLTEYWKLNTEKNEYKRVFEEKVNSDSLQMKFYVPFSTGLEKVPV